jgi:hypothetical protein
MVPVNYLAVLAATVLSMIIGSLWFGPLFGKTWMKLMDFKKSDMNGISNTQMAKLYGIQLVGSLFMAFVLSHALIFASTYLGESGISAGLQTGFWNWLGFVAPVTVGSVLWEGKSWKLWFFNNSYYLVTLCSMGILLSLWK